MPPLPDSDSPKIPIPDPDSLISKEAVQRLRTTPIANQDGNASYVYRELSLAMNHLGYIAGLLPSVLSGEYDSKDRALMRMVPPIAREKLNYRGLEEIADIKLRLQARLDQIQKFDKQFPPSTKIAVHDTFRAAFECFDPDPENLEAKHFRNAFQQAAQILEIPPLDKNPTSAITPASAVSGTLDQHIASLP